MVSSAERHTGGGWIETQKKRWLCVRQRAGPLVKECRAIRPRLSKTDTQWETTEKNKILRPPLDSSVRRTPTDRVELMLALLGRSSTVYILTFDDQHLPDTYQGVRNQFKLFIRRLRRWRKETFDYVYVIEGRHGDHRYHIHLVLRNADFSPAEIRYLWGQGEEVEDVPLLAGPEDSFRRTARYLTKESTDGITLPIGAKTWGCSKGLYSQLPKIETFWSTTGRIRVPKGSLVVKSYNTENAFGIYHYVSYIAPPCARVRHS